MYSHDDVPAFVLQHMQHDLCYLIACDTLRIKIKLKAATYWINAQQPVTKCQTCKHGATNEHAMGCWQGHPVNQICEPTPDRLVHPVQV